MSFDKQEIEKTEFFHTQYLNSEGIYILMSAISSETIKPVVQWILYENFKREEKNKELTLIICSEGGELAAAFALIDVMNSSSIPIKTVGIGQIASCGLLIFMNGTRGRRILTPNTSILSHQFSWHSQGKVHELFATVREFELTQIRMINHYKHCTGQNEDTIREYFLPAQDRWLSADEAYTLKLCDKVSHTADPTSYE